MLSIFRTRLNCNIKVKVNFLKSKTKAPVNIAKAKSRSQASLPRKATVVTNCNIRAVPSKMAWLFAVLAKVVLAGETKNKC